MEVTFWGVRASIPAPGPTTVRYGGNTSCISIRSRGGNLLVVDCGTGARNLGLALLGDESPDTFRAGHAEAAILLSHTHWDHIQGLPFFGPLYVEGNVFKVYGPAKSAERLEALLEVQMAPQYFPVQTLKNMGARIEVVAVPAGAPFDVFDCRVTAVVNPHGGSGALAFRIEDGSSSLVYASDAGYGEAGPSAEALALYADADLLIHDSTFGPADRERQRQKGSSGVAEAVHAAMRARARKLALFHYDQDDSDADIDALVSQAQRELRSAGASLEVLAGAEGLTLPV